MAALEWSFQGVRLHMTLQDARTSKSIVALVELERLLCCVHPYHVDFKMTSCNARIIVHLCGRVCLHVFFSGGLILLFHIHIDCTGVVYPRCVRCEEFLRDLKEVTCLMEILRDFVIVDWVNAVNARLRIAFGDV